MRLNCDAVNDSAIADDAQVGNDPMRCQEYFRFPLLPIPHLTHLLHRRAPSEK